MHFMEASGRDRKYCIGTVDGYGAKHLLNTGKSSHHWRKFGREGGGT